MIHARVEKRLGAFRLEAEVEAGPGVTALYGPSGGGKTTLLACIAGVLAPDAGVIRLGAETLLDTARGVRVPPERRRIGVVFQEPRLFPHMTVRANIAYGARLLSRAERPRDEDEVVNMLSLGRLLDRRPDALSGGERRRAAIARALLAAPRALLMDEPLAHVDQEGKDRLLPYLQRLRAYAKIPILYVTHDLAEVTALADACVVLGEGKVVARGGPEAALRSLSGASPAAFPVFENRLTGRVGRSDPEMGTMEVVAGGARLAVPYLPAEEGAAMSLVIPASDVLVARGEVAGLSAGNLLAARIVALREAGRVVLLEARIEGASATIHAEITPDAVRALALAEGEACTLIVKRLSIRVRPA